MRRQNGFSLIEVMLALSLAMMLAAAMFQLFHQNERVMRDQTLIMEMQQTARIVASQIADEVRMAGQGVPVYATAFAPAPSESVAVFLGSSSTNRIDFRAGLSNVETVATGASPYDFSIGISRSISVTTASGFSIGRYVYISGPTAPSTLSWIRAEVTGVTSVSLTLVPRDAGSIGGTIHFTAAPTVTMEEAVSISLNNGAIRRATATSMSSDSIPSWSPANELGRMVTVLKFTYYDAAANVLQPSTLQNRLAIARIDVQLTVEAAGPLSNGTRPAYSLSFRTVPRNMRLL